jgi:hypothetical protein
MTDTAIRALTMVCQALNRLSSGFWVQVAIALFLLGAVSPSYALPATEFYFVMEFDAEIEGERLAFETKIGCLPNSSPTGSGGKRLFYSRLPAAFGMRLKSGKGAFVAVPNVCSWYFARGEDGQFLGWTLPEPEKALLPSIYITDDYENPQYLTYYSNPHGPDPKTGVRLIRCVVRPHSSLLDVFVPELTADPNNPFLRAPGTSLNPPWPAFSFFPLIEIDAVRVRANLGQKILETPRYRLYRHSDHLRKIFPGIHLVHTKAYWEASVRNGVVRVFGPNYRRYNKGALAENVLVPLALELHSNNLPIRYDGKAFTVDFDTAGVWHALSKALSAQNLGHNRMQRLIIDGAETGFSTPSSAVARLVLHDVVTGQLYVMQRAPIRISN